MKHTFCLVAASALACALLCHGEETARTEDPPVPQVLAETEMGIVSNVVRLYVLNPRASFLLANLGSKEMKTPTARAELQKLLSLDAAQHVIPAHGRRHAELLAFLERYARTPIERELISRIPPPGM